MCLSNSWVRVRSVTSCIDCLVPLLALSLSAGSDPAPGGMCPCAGAAVPAQQVGAFPSLAPCPGAGSGGTFGGRFPAVTSCSRSTRSSSEQGWNFGPFQLTFCSPDVRCEPPAPGGPPNPPEQPFPSLPGVIDVLFSLHSYAGGMGMLELAAGWRRAVPAPLTAAHRAQPAALVLLELCWLFSAPVSPPELCGVCGVGANPAAAPSRREGSPSLL